jgi:glycine betaine/proline transport system ATP-binding protein
MEAIQFDHVDVIFGKSPVTAAALLDEGVTKDDILARTENVVAVRDASLAVREGEICVLMGLSGSGKSSLLRCVNGLNKISRGRLRIRQDEEMIDLSGCDPTVLHRLRTERIAMVFQQFALMPWRTVSENVALGLELSGVPRRRQREIVAEKLAMVRLEAWADVYPNELSGGMQQRVGLARALATDADILLMDEPFSALDPLIREHLQDELLQLQQDLKKTILFVSHDLDEALKLGDQVAIMENGRIVQAGTPETIVSAPANDYVHRFVATMNPLKVLSCQSLMRPVEALAEAGSDKHAKLLDEATRVVCTLDDNGRLQHVVRDDQAMTLVPYQEDLDVFHLPPHTLVTADRRMPMRTAVQIHHACGLPLPVVDRSGRLVGVVGTPEIFRGILREGGNKAAGKK